MKARIIQTLADLSNGSPEELQNNIYYQILQEYFESAGHGDLDLPHQARQVLNRILNDYSNFSVSTIESFFQRIVRAFARELNISLGFEVEMRQTKVMELMVDQLLLGLGSDTHLTKLLEGFVNRNLAEQRTWNIDHEIRQLGQEVFKEKYQQLNIDANQANLWPANPLAVTLDLAQDLQKIQQRFEATLIEMAEAAESLMQAYGVRYEDIKYKSAGPVSFIYKILHKQDFKAPGKRCYDGYENPSHWYKAGSEESGRVEAALEAGLMGLHCDMLDYYQAESRNYQSARQVGRSIYSFGLLSRLQEELANYRRENARLIISDTNFLLREVMGEEHDAPFIYEKVGTQYRHYLLDEFQDTSDLQWSNLLPLVRDALAQGGGSLVVGDAKQSIYRWRNGNLKLLLRGVAASIRDMGQRPVVKTLDRNFRTSVSVVQFNNEFFSRAAERLAPLFPEEGQILFDEAYHAVAQEPVHHQVKGYVEVRFLTRPKKGEEDLLSWQEQALEQTEATIASLFEEGFKGEEICLLVRTNRDGVQLAEHLQRKGIKVISAESLLIASHPGVQLLLALLRHLNHEEDSISRAALLRFYFQVEEGGPAPHSSYRKTSSSASFSLSEWGEAATNFERLKEELRQLAVYECLERLLRIFPVLADPNAYVQGFMDSVLEYSGTQDASIEGFLQWWAEQANSRAVAAAPDPTAVQIMTIHKSKGLEFPVVMLPFCEWDLGASSKGVLWIKPEQTPYDRFPFLPLRPSKALEETFFEGAYEQENLESYLDNLNLLYVAFTRPQYRLYAFAPQSSSSKKSGTEIRSTSQLLLHLLSELPEGRIEGDGNLYCFGQAQDRTTIAKLKSEKKKTQLEQRSLKINKSPHGDWNQAIRVRSQAQRFLAEDLLSRQEKIDEGKLIHEALAYVETITDVEPALRKLMVQGLLASKQQARLQGRLNEVVQFPEASPWFDGSWEVRNEAEIITPSGQLLRPDRVMIKGSQAIVVDYKSGLPYDSHQKQVQNYAAALQSMGYAQVSGYVYYLAKLEIVRCY